MSLIFLSSFPSRWIFAQFSRLWGLFVPPLFCSVVLSALVSVQAAQFEPMPVEGLTGAGTSGTNAT